MLEATLETEAKGSLPPGQPAVGMNVIGCWSATTGLAEAARRSALAALSCGVDLSLEHLEGLPMDPARFPVAPGRFPPALKALPRGRPYDIDLCYLNVNDFEVISDDDLRDPTNPRYLIGCWFWELASLPDFLVPHVQRVDEIWAPTNYVANTFRYYGATNVQLIPCVVEPSANEGLQRRDFGLPSTGCLFLFHFDAHSTFARKNPFGLVEAFRRAFAHHQLSREVHLVIKAINLKNLPEGRSLLQEQVASVGGTLVEDELTAKEVASLVALSDVYVSLHRAEGFGMGIAEAMYFGKPVIATAFSGPEDFLTRKNACMVGFRSRPIVPGELYLNHQMQRLYQEGMTWAEPDLEQAARWMRWLVERPSDRRKIGEEASKTIRNLFSSSTVGTAIRARIRTIRSERSSPYRPSATP